MPAENAIELFNCSLCSYCETSLDGLACHIRKHIKPEPYSIGKEILTASTSRTTNTITNIAENALLHMNENESSYTSPKPNSNDNIKGVVETGHSTTVTNHYPGSMPLSSRVDVTDPKTLTVNSHVHNNEPPKSIFSPPTCRSDYTHSPIMLEKPQMPRNTPPQSLVRNNIPNNIPNMSPQSRQENMPQVTRYIQLHPREHPYMEMNSNRPFPNPYVANINGKPTLVHTDMGPTAHSKNNFQEMPPVSMDAHQIHPRETFFRNMPPSDRPSVTQKNMISSPYSGIVNQPNRVHLSPGSDARMRANHPYEMHNQSAPHSQNNPHYSYQPKPVTPQDNIDKPFSPKFHNLFYSDVLSPVPPYTAHASRMNTMKAASRVQDTTQTKQYQTQLSNSNMQLSDTQKQYPNMGVPNNGTIILNPDQLLSATGNQSMDQLAGILVVPLKKTCEIGCQTDPVSFSSTGDSNDGNRETRSVQTELHMREITEGQNCEPLFDSFRPTDSLFECLVCGEEFLSDFHLQDHVSKLHTHICEKCYHSSSNIHDHHMHITDCGKKDTEIICIDCNCSFPSLKKLHQHRSKFHNVRMPFRCGVCNVPFETHEAVMKHISTHDQYLPEFKCRYCSKVFQSAVGLGKHFNRHKGVDVLHECRFCKKSFTTHKMLQDHISYAHVIKNADDNSSSETVYATGSPARLDKMQMGDNIVASAKKYPLCRYCDLAFKTNEHMQKHVDICSKNSNVKVSAFLCDICKEYYYSDQDKRQHVKKEHKRNSGFRCPKCSKIYRTWSRLKFHTKQQHIKKTCADCLMIFTKEHILRKHQEEEHGKPQGQPGERVYTCSYCNTMLNSLAELMSHRKEVHPELSQLKSADKSSGATMLSFIDQNGDMDDKGISDSNGVNKKNILSGSQTSSLTDAGLKDGSSHNCDKCDSIFEDEKRLKNHKGLIHGEKPFSCTECRKSFQYSSQVVWHMRIHRKKDKNSKISSKLWKSKNKPFPMVSSRLGYVCQFCGAKFSQEKLLNNHKGSIHKIKLFACDLCNTKCGHSTELIWHMRTCRAKFKRKNPGLEFPARESKSAKLDYEEDDNDDDDDGSTIDGDGYVCHICDNAFTHFEDYQSHMLSHPGEEVPAQISSLAVKQKNKLSNNEKIKGESGGNREKSSSSSPQLQNASISQEAMDDDDADDLLNIDPEYDPSSGEYICPICQKPTKSMTGMKTHYGRVHGVWSKATSHKEGKHVNKEHMIWPCKNCDRLFASLGSLRHHSTLIHGFSVNEDDVDVIRPGQKETEVYQEEKFSCPYCAISFSSSKSIRVHAFKKHGTVLSDEEVNEWRSGGNGDMSSTGEPIKKSIRFKCTKCNSKFSTGKAVRIHLLKQHNHILSKNDVSKCRLSVKALNSTTPLVSKPKAKDLDYNVYPCDPCGRVFANYRAYSTHYRQAHRPPPIASEVLPDTTKHETQEFTKTYPYRSHEKKDYSEETLPSVEKKETKDTIDCPKCDRSYSQNKSFLTHIHTVHRISTDEYAKYWPDGLPTLTRTKARCPTCDKQCVNDRAMRIHFFQAHGILYSDMIKKNFEVPEDGELSTSTPVGNEGVDIDPEGESHNESQLRFVEEEVKGPPFCFICGRLFKNKRALMTHEYKYHGIRWVGRKRIFPPKVRNVPHLKNSGPRNAEKSSPKVNIDNTEENILIDTPQLNSDSVITRPVQSFEFICPLCGSGFNGRRGITTHLCRLHMYRKEDLRLFFAEIAANSVTIPSTENSIDISSTPQENSENVSSMLENPSTDVIDPSNENASDIENSSQENVSDIENSSQENASDIENSSQENASDIEHSLPENPVDDEENSLHENASDENGHFLENPIGVESPSLDNAMDVDSSLQEKSLNIQNSIDIKFEDFDETETLRNGDKTLLNGPDCDVNDNISVRDIKASIDTATNGTIETSDMEDSNDIEAYDDIEDELGGFSLFSGEYNVEL